VSLSHGTALLRLIVEPAVAHDPILLIGAMAVPESPALYQEFGFIRSCEKIADMANWKD
jgi:hypothetical protein